MTTGLVLLPGAGLGAWVWRDVQPLLDGPSLAIDYDRSGGVTHYAEQVLMRTDDWNETDRVVLVCHSLGGVVGLKTAALLADRLAGIMGVGAVVPAKGGSFVSAMPAPQRYVLSLIMRLAGTRPPESEIRKGYGSDLPAELIDEVVQRFTPETRQVYTEPAGAAAPAVPASYVALSKDDQLPAKLQQRMGANLGATDVTTLPTGHLPMLSQPAALADLLNTFAAQLRT